MQFSRIKEQNCKNESTYSSSQTSKHPYNYLSLRCSETCVQIRKFYRTRPSIFETVVITARHDRFFIYVRIICVFDTTTMACQSQETVSDRSTYKKLIDAVFVFNRDTFKYFLVFTCKYCVGIRINWNKLYTPIKKSIYNKITWIPIIESPIGNKQNFNYRLTLRNGVNVSISSGRKTVHLLTIIPDATSRIFDVIYIFNTHIKCNPRPSILKYAKSTLSLFEYSIRENARLHSNGHLLNFRCRFSWKLWDLCALVWHIASLNFARACNEGMVEVLNCVIYRVCRIRIGMRTRSIVVIKYCCAFRQRLCDIIVCTRWKKRWSAE